jgi:hypothetical protein
MAECDLLLVVIPLLLAWDNLGLTVHSQIQAQIHTRILSQIQAPRHALLHARILSQIQAQIHVHIHKFVHGGIFYESTNSDC